MKEQKIGPLPLPLLTLAGGVVGFFLRQRMLTVGYDAKGVQLAGSWPYIGLWVLTSVVLAALAALCLYMGDRSSYEENFKPSPVAGGCAIGAGAALFACSVIQLLDKPDVFSVIVNVLGLGGASALAMNGYLRLSGKSSAPAGMLVSLYLAAWLVARFRGWSTDPLLGDYCFELLACVFAMLAAYQLAGFPIGKGRRRASLFCSMAAVYFCLISLADPDWAGRLFFLAVALWLFTGSCTLNKPAPRRRKLGGGFVEPEEPAEQGDAT